MQLFYAPDFVPPCHTLGEEESRHCVRVLRLSEGDEVHLTDGRGTLYRCRIVGADPRRCSVEAVETLPDFEPLPYRLVMGVAPPKNADRFEWLLEKATEVGVSAVVPLETDHSERRVFRPQRGEKVITAAIKQSLKAFRPELMPLAPLRKVLEGPFEGRKFIAHCAEPRSQAGKRYLPAALRPGEAALVLIGPEGDFSAGEIDAALACGFEEITLGSQRLRTETAALTAVVMASVVNGIKNEPCHPEEQSDEESSSA
ncbi:MAG: 16S rRNA (uracil(1498)-N(3))-methyltransferase [Alistipes sp.]|nr:16S rRNA (uracil(1498)-N(3))-methyltransferase [Alistipes sp.]